MSKILHNPKSYAPAVYIPCWLIQIPIKSLSHGAKMTYGRLSQWANELGRVFRSSIQLSEELGCSVRSIEYHIKELKNAGLIGTFHPQAGGVNHFEFYDHPWMHEPIKEQLVYKQDKYNPPQNLAEPSAESCGTPPQNLAGINKKEIKRNNKPPLTPRSAGESLFFFFSFLSLFPAVKNKSQCQKIWIKLGLEEQGETIINRLKEQIEKDDQWKRGYYPGALNYLKNDGWNDDIVQTKPDLDKIKKIASQKEAQKRVEQQEKLSIANAEHLKIKAMDNKDAVTYRKIVGDVMTNQHNGLNGLKKALGIKNNEAKLEKQI